MSTLAPDEIARFEADGVLLLRGAVPAEHVALMRELLWRRLLTIGVREDDPSTWRTMNSRPLQRIMRHPRFAALGSPRLRGAIDDLVGAGRWLLPTSWGMFRLTAPAPGPAWQVPTGWHSDCAPWDQQQALFIFIHIGDTAPGGGATCALTGSHRRLARMAEGIPAGHQARRRMMRAFHDGSPWLRQLLGVETSEQPRSRFLAEDSPPDAYGIRIRAVECTGQPGDVWLCHATIQHSASDNRSDRLRMMRLCMLQLCDGQARDDLASGTPLARSVQEPADAIRSRGE
jgi:hypothetical protein